MLTREFIRPDHTVRFTVIRDVEGWEVREERDDTVVRHQHYLDWHRVERAMRSFELAHEIGAEVRDRP